jgi:hypothetical protein
MSVAGFRLALVRHPSQKELVDKGLHVILSLVNELKASFTASRVEK